MRYGPVIALVSLAASAFAADPATLVATGRTDTQIHVHWDANGKTSFTLDYLGPEHFGGDPGCNDFPLHTNIFVTSSSTVVINGLTPSTRYQIHVHAIGPEETGRTNILIVRTRAAGLGFESLVPGSPEYTNCGGHAARDRAVDLDRDFKADHTAFHPSTGLWYVRRSSDTSVTTLGYGGAGYTPVPGDYEGDDRTDVAVYHPPSGLWFIRASSTGTDSTAGFGGAGYQPVRGDFDGDVKTDLAVFHDATGLWFVRSSFTGTVQTIGYGASGYVPVEEDYDGDGITDFAVYHEPTGLWFSRSSATTTTTTVGFGGPGFNAVN